MKNNEKLKIVFDFIADYLSEEETAKTETDKEESNKIEITENDEIVETPFGNSLKRAYKLMKIMEDKDKENALIKHQVRKEVDPIKEELNRVKAEYAEKIIKEKEKEETRTGVTLDDKGNLVKVEVPHITEEFIKQIESNPPMTAEEWDKITNEANNDELISKNKKEVLEAFEDKMEDIDSEINKIKRKPKSKPKK